MWANGRREDAKGVRPRYMAPCHWVQEPCAPCAVPRSGSCHTLPCALPPSPCAAHVHTQQRERARGKPQVLNSAWVGDTNLALGVAVTEHLAARAAKQLGGRRLEAVGAMSEAPLGICDGGIRFAAPHLRASFEVPPRHKMPPSSIALGQAHCSAECGSYLRIVRLHSCSHKGVHRQQIHCFPSGHNRLSRLHLQCKSLCVGLFSLSFSTNFSSK